tara:strand:- start:82356 stop:83021 length:666 start_codon:yes stop_codon:yes gene_type:complete
LKREIIITSDGSTTIHLPEWNEQYHSKHGAIQEAYHVFIKHGLDQLIDQHKIRILEIGFGTGLNCLITYLEGVNKNIQIDYTGVEAYPVELDEVQKLNYISALKAKNYSDFFSDIHTLPWNISHKINTAFSLTKRKQFFSEIDDEEAYNLIYFDAFGARVQPELWTVDLFSKMYKALKTQGILVTYSAKGSVRRAMVEVGFTVERLPGPPGKREMLRAVKT